MDENKKLYLVTLKGRADKSQFYVVETDPTAAYESVRKLLDEKDWRFISEREFDTIKLIADSDILNDNTILLIQE